MWSAVHTKDLLSEPLPTLQSCPDWHRESLLAEKQKSVYRVVTSSTHHEARMSKKRGCKQTIFCFCRTKRRLLLCCGLWCHRHGSSSSWPLALLILNQLYHNENMRAFTRFIAKLHQCVVTVLSVCFLCSLWGWSTKTVQAASPTKSFSVMELGTIYDTDFIAKKSSDTGCHLCLNTYIKITHSYRGLWWYKRCSHRDGCVRIWP